MGDRNRRRYNRLRSRGASVRLSVGSSPAKALLMVGNISAGGLFVRTSALLPVGTRVHMELTAPGIRTPLKVEGTVANSVDAREAAVSGRAEGMGIEFTGLNDALHKRLQEVLGALQATNRGSSDEGTRPERAPSSPSASAASDPFSGDFEVRKADGRERRPAHAAPSASGRSTPAPLGTSGGISLEDLQTMLRIQREQIARLMRENEALRAQLRSAGLSLAGAARG